jgi:hypothetical protein
LIATWKCAEEAGSHSAQPLRLGGARLLIDTSGSRLVARSAHEALVFDIRGARPVLLRQALVADPESDLALGKDGWLRRASDGTRLRRFAGTFWAWSPHEDPSDGRVSYVEFDAASGTVVDHGANLTPASVAPQAYADAAFEWPFFGSD